MRIVINLSAFLFLSINVNAQNKSVSSPDGKVNVNIEVSDNLTFKVVYDGNTVIDKGSIALELAKETLGENPKLIKSETKSVNEKVSVAVPMKNSVIDNNYNSLLLSFKGKYQVEFRAFNNGVAYRFITRKRGDLIVKSEKAEFSFAGNYKVFNSPTEKRFSNYEHVFKKSNLENLSADSLFIIPAFVDAGKSKVLIAEADVYDYPVMLLKGGNGNKILGWQPNEPKKYAPIVNDWVSDRRLAITEENDYIAKTKGKRSFPWRVFALATADKDIATNDLVYLLSRSSEYKNFDWIKPGQTSWEWWHASNIIGVDFESGYNTETYKYYIDFASKYGLRYVLLDEGWSKTVEDIMEPNPDIDLEELIRYGHEKNVDVILWASWLSTQNHPEFFEKVSKMGVKGVKIDFMDRSDQWMMNYYERTAKLAFENKLLVDFHGSITPRGLRRAYPNIISYEGLTGMEQNKVGGFDLPDNRVILPFTRNVVGPMDYTPGAMKSVHPKFWHANWANPMSIGTRAHQMALFVVFESGLQMLADNPSDYYKENECTEYITDVPTTWDETVILDGKIGEYIVSAKRKGDTWYIGGITNSESRVVELDLSFLKGNYTMELFKDGVNAKKYAIDYKKTVTDVSSTDKVEVKMEINGGFAAKLTKK